MRTAGEPRLDLGGFVGGIVIHDDMDIEPFGDLSIDLLEEAQELGRSVTLVAFADDEPRGDIERGKKRGRTMPHIAVRATLGYARHHRQDRLFAIECLDLAHMGIRGSRSTSLISWESPVVASYPGFEPVCMIRPVSDAASNSHPVAALSVVGCTNIPLASGKGSGGRDHSLLRLFEPGQISVRSPGSARADEALGD